MEWASMPDKTATVTTETLTAALQAQTEVMQKMSQNIVDLAHCIATQDSSIRLLHTRVERLEAAARHSPLDA
jgi:hypothetical protein